MRTPRTLRPIKPFTPASHGREPLWSFDSTRPDINRPPFRASNRDERSGAVDGKTGQGGRIASRVKGLKENRRSVLKRAEVHGVGVAWAVERRVHKKVRRRAIPEIRFPINYRSPFSYFERIDSASRIRDLDGQGLPNKAAVLNGLPIRVLNDDGREERLAS